MDITQTPPAIYGEAEAGRSNRVRREIEILAQELSTATLDLADLLAEATDKDYFTQWGYLSRAQFAEEKLDMKERQIQYLVRIVTIERKLKIRREQIQNIAITKLKDIFSLDPEGFYYNPDTEKKEPLDAHIHRLIDLAPNVGYEAIRAEVRRLKGLVGENELTWLNLQVTRQAKEEVFERAMEFMRRRLGDAGRDENGKPKDYSDGAVMEMITAEWLSDPQNTAADEQSYREKTEEIPQEVQEV